MGLTYQQAVEQTITGAEQFHQIVNGSGATEIVVEDGSTIPSVRKALLDNFYFKDPISWVQGSSEVVFNQLRKFTDGTLWYSPFATTSSPVSMGTTPIGDSNWFIYSFDAVTKLTPQLREALRRSYADSGYTLVTGSFEKGATLNTNTDAILYESTGRVYTWSGTFPKIVSPSSTPSGGSWVDISNSKSLSVILNALSADNGATLVAGKGSVTGEVKRLQSDRNAQNLSICDFGGVDDCVGTTTGTNNYTAISNYFNYLAASGGEGIFPKRNTGGYYINGNQVFSDLSGIEIIAEEGVYFVFDGNWTPLITKGIKCNRQIKIYIKSLDYWFYLGPEQYRKPSEILPVLNQKTGTFEVPKTISGTNFNGYLLNTVNGRDSASIVTATDYITITPSSNSEKKVAAIKAKIKDEIGVTMLGASSGTLCIGVLTVNGYSLVEQRLSDGYTVVNKNSNTSTVNMASYVGTRNQFNAAALSVQIISDTLYSVLVNDITIGTFDAGESITSFAVGVTGTTTALVVGDIYKVENATINGSRPLRIICLGDSISDPNIPCSQFDYMRQFLASAGCQVVELNNLAVSGETSAQQLARFLNVGIANYDYCIAQIGVNDIQGGVPVSTFIANMEAIADRCVNNNVKLIAGIPTVWYPSSEALPFGQTGQNTANSEAGAIYRNRLRKSMAAKGQLVTSSPLRNEGLIAAQWLSNIGMDPVLMDNIHPTAYGRIMLGLGSALSIIGAQNPQGYRSRVVSSFPARWKSSFTSASTTLPNVIVDNGELSFVGSISLPSVPVNGTVILTIDKELANGNWNYYTVPAQSAGGPVGMCNVVVDPNGNVSVYSVPVGTTNITLDSVKIKRLY